MFNITIVKPHTKISKVFKEWYSSLKTESCPNGESGKADWIMRDLVKLYPHCAVKTDWGNAHCAAWLKFDPNKMTYRERKLFVKGWEARGEHGSSPLEYTMYEHRKDEIERLLNELNSGSPESLQFHAELKYGRIIIAGNDDAMFRKPNYYPGKHPDEYTNIVMFIDPRGGVNMESFFSGLCRMNHSLGNKAPDHADRILRELGWKSDKWFWEWNPKTQTVSEFINRLL